jgi:hypothetical protein
MWSWRGLLCLRDFEGGGATHKCFSGCIRYGVDNWGWRELEKCAASQDMGVKGNTMIVLISSQDFTAF